MSEPPHPTGHPPTWRIQSGSALIYIMGSAPPPPEPWHSDFIEQLLLQSRVFWNETPEAGPDTIPTAIQYGVDRERPLAWWLDAADLSRVEILAQTLDVAAPLLAAVRPWFACQLLQNADRERKAIPFSNGCDPVLSKLAAENGLHTRHEFESLEAFMRHMVALPQEAEVGYLQYYLDELETPESSSDELARLDLWADGDVSREEASGQRTATRYPAFYEAMVVARNRAWLPRVEELVRENARAFLLIGTGHLVGPGNLIDLLTERGFTPERI